MEEKKKSKEKFIRRLYWLRCGREINANDNISGGKF